MTSNGTFETLDTLGMMFYKTHMLVALSTQYHIGETNGYLSTGAADSQKEVMGPHR